MVCGQPCPQLFFEDKNDKNNNHLLFFLSFLSSKRKKLSSHNGLRAALPAQKQSVDQRQDIFHYGVACGRWTNTGHGSGQDVLGGGNSLGINGI